MKAAVVLFAIVVACSASFIQGPEQGDVRPDQRTVRSAEVQQAEEKELLVRLAWLLDKLAQLTGFEPDTETFVEMASPEPTAAPAKAASPAKSIFTKSNPATKIEKATRESRETAPTFQSKNLVKKSTSTTKNRSENMDLLAQASGPVTKNTMTAVKSIRKRSIDNDPMFNVIKYYVKHKVWTSSNQNNFNHDSPFYTHNFLTQGNSMAAKNRDKRSLNLGDFLIHKPIYNGQPPNPNLKIAVEKLLRKKIEFIKNLKPKPKIYKRSADNVEFVSEDPFYDPNYLKNIDGADVYNTQQASEVLKNIENLHSIPYEKYTHNDYTIIHSKTHHQPSSFYKKKIQIKIPEDPSQDISSYVKIKPGTNIVPNAAQAAAARLALEAIFQTGNIETIRRYNANYNPLNPRPLNAGIQESALDIF